MLVCTGEWTGTHSFSKKTQKTGQFRHSKQKFSLKSLRLSGAAAIRRCVHAGEKVWGTTTWRHKAAQVAFINKLPCFARTHKWMAVLHIYMHRPEVCQQMQYTETLKYKKIIIIKKISETKLLHTHSFSYSYLHYPYVSLKGQVKTVCWAEARVFILTLLPWKTDLKMLIDDLRLQLWRSTYPSPISFQRWLYSFYMQPLHADTCTAAIQLIWVLLHPSCAAFIPKEWIK